MAGTLYIVSTPIGDPEEITLRAIRTLHDVGLIIAEHPTVTRALLDRFGIATAVTGYDADDEKLAVLLDRLRTGETMALVCDAGTPAIWDPGQRLIARAHADGMIVRPVTGPSAVIAAVAVSGLEGEGFVFVGAFRSGTRATTT